MATLVVFRCVAIPFLVEEADEFRNAEGILPRLDERSSLCGGKGQNIQTEGTFNQR